MFSSIKGYSVVVTGGTKGIGKGIARVFAAAGANVVITGRNEDDAKRLCDEINAHGAGQVSYVLADVANIADNKKLAEIAIERNGGIDVLCANAGIYPGARLDVMTEDDYNKVFDTNVKGMFFCVQACLPALVKSGHGRIILTSSITGPYTGLPGWSHYGASKSAQLGFMRTAAIEYAKQGITVNAILPGNIATEGLADEGPEYLAAMEASVPQGRLGDVEDIGYAALYFASREAGYVTGQALVVDGGQVLPESLAALDVVQ